jgi:hypothetical protein
MQSQFAPTPVHGAAFRWMFEQCNPGSCSTREGLIEIETKVSDALAWTKNQPDHVRDAYEWAAAQTLATARDRLEIFDNSRAVSVAYESLPKPSVKAA